MQQLKVEASTVEKYLEDILGIVAVSKDYFYSSTDFEAEVVEFLASASFASLDQIESKQFVKKIISSLFKSISTSIKATNSIDQTTAYSSFLATLSYVDSIALTIVAINSQPMFQQEFAVTEANHSLSSIDTFQVLDEVDIDYNEVPEDNVNSKILFSIFLYLLLDFLL